MAPGERGERARWQAALAVLRSFRGEQLGLRAGNLSFITLTALVPLAAVILSLVHVFQEKRIDGLVMHFFEEVLSPGGRQQTEAVLKRFLEAARSRTASGVSFSVLLVSSGVLLRHLDASLNEIWVVPRRRSWAVSILLYAGVLVAGPFLMVVGLLGSDGARRALTWLGWPLVPQSLLLGALASATGAFALLYKLAPTVPVRWSSALRGGLAAGIAWELARRLYGSIASLFLSANPLYGSLGVAPLFLMWIYVGWYIVLAGARLAYAFDVAEPRHAVDPVRVRELLCARVAGVIARAYLDRAPAPTTDAIAATLAVPPRRVADALFPLESNGLVLSKNGRWHPSQEPAQLTLADVIQAVSGRRPQSLDDDAVAQLLADVDATTIEKLKGMSWSALAEPLAPPVAKA